MAHTEVKPEACLFAPSGESADAVIASALGQAGDKCLDWLALCRSDPAVLLAWVWQDGQQPALPLWPSQQSNRWRLRRHQTTVDRLYASRLLARWASWHPSWLPDWSRPGLAQCRQTMHLAGLLARQIASLARSSPDKAEVAARSVALGWIVASRFRRQLPLLCLSWLAGHWPLPKWLQNIWRRLDDFHPLNPRSAAEKLLRVVQCSWQLAQTQVGLAPQLAGPAVPDLLAALNIDPADISVAETKLPPLSPADPGRLWAAIGQLINHLTTAQRCASKAEQELTHWRHQATQLAERQEQIVHERKLQALAVFAAGAGHELGSPLAVISGYAEQLLHGEKRLDRIQALHCILAQTRRIHSIVLDLMFFARPLQPNKRRLRLDRLLDRVVRQLLPEAGHKQLRFSSDLSRPVPIVADGRLLETALACLLRNAIEAAPVGGQIQCTLTQPHSGQVQVIVEDTGPGPDPAWQEHIFDPFFSGRQAGRGRGFGLCKAWRIAQIHSGRITWCRTPNQTTQFILQLPTR